MAMAMSRNGSKASSENPSNWGQQQRLEFIEFRLFWEGRLNRSDLMEFFGISRPQASLDLARYIEAAPQNITYDKKQKTYLANRRFKPVLAPDESSAYLGMLLASHGPQASFVGSMPPLGVVIYPHRRIETSVLRQVLLAIRGQLTLGIEYQSMNRPNPTVREISPHAIAFDGFRWHARAYCHVHDSFRDFVFARIIKVHKSLPSSVDPKKDDEWHHLLNLVISPNPDLSPGQKRAVALDYGMKKGRIVVRTRRALAFYLLRQLGLDDTGSAAKAQHIVLLNRDEIEPLINDKDRPQ